MQGNFLALCAQRRMEIRTPRNGLEWLQRHNQTLLSDRAQITPQVLVNMGPLDKSNMGLRYDA